MESDLRKLAVRNITEYIHEIEYAGTLVLAYKYGGCVNYINASKLCKDDNKEFKHWYENKQSQSLIDCLFTHINFGMTREEIEKANIVIQESFIQIHGGSDVKIRGTYVHPNILTWLGKSHNQIGQFITHLGKYGITVKDIIVPNKIQICYIM
jgi:hypothetical protein